MERTKLNLIQSQLVLFNSRKKWGLLYSLATLAGLFCVPGVLETMAAEHDLALLIQKTAPLPLISLLVATGMYILNDLVDADLDRANGKKRPIPSGLVSKGRARFFVLATNSLAVVLSAVTLSSASVIILIPMLAIGIIYSAPRIALMNRFVLKTLSISTFYALCALLGITSSYGIGPFFQDPVVPLFSISILGMMIFISSTLNDLGDASGDKAAGRKTIPVVMGASSTIRFLILLAVGMAALSIALYGFIGPLFVSLIAVFTVLIITRLKKISGGIQRMDVGAIRTQHKRIFPLHIMLQVFLVMGAFLVP